MIVPRVGFRHLSRHARTGCSFLKSASFNEWHLINRLSYCRSFLATLQPLIDRVPMSRLATESFRLLNCPLEAELAMPSLRVPLRSLTDLAPGTLLELGRSTTQPATLFVAGQEMFHASLARRGPVRAAQVLDRIQKPANESRKTKLTLRRMYRRSLLSARARNGSSRISGRVDRKHHSDADSDRGDLAHVGIRARAARRGSGSPQTGLASDGGGRRIAMRRNESAGASNCRSGPGTAIYARTP
jgi:hypothetical protein